MGIWSWFKERVEDYIEDPSDNVNTTTIANPFVVKKTPDADHYAVGHFYGETIGNEQFTSVELWAAGDSGLVHIGLKDPIENKESFVLAAVTNGMLRLVPEGTSRTVPGTDRLPAGKVVVNGPAYILQGLAPAIDALYPLLNADRWIGLGLSPPNRPVPTVIVYENIEVTDDIDELIETLFRTEKKPPWWTDARIGELVTSWKDGDSTVYVKAGYPIGRPREEVPSGTVKPPGIADSARYVKISVYDEFGAPIDLGWLLRHVDLHAKDTFIDQLAGPNVDIFRKDPVRGLLPRHDIIDIRDEHGLPYRNHFFQRFLDDPFPEISSVFDIELASLLLQDDEDILTENGSPKTGAAGLWLGPGVDAADRVDIQGVGIKDHLLGFLPSCPSSSVIIKLRGYPGDYHRIIALPLNKWFPEQPNAIPGAAPKRFHLGCRVTPLIDGQAAHAAIGDAIRACYERDDDDPPSAIGLRPDNEIAKAHVWLCNWLQSPATFPYGGSDELYEKIEPNAGTNPDFQLGLSAYPEDSLGFYLQSAIAAGVDIRLLPWYHHLLGDDRNRNVEITRAANQFYDRDAYHTATGPSDDLTARGAQDVTGLTSIPENLRRGFGLVDDKTRAQGSHHQKVSYIHNRYGHFAFLGGIDLTPSRWDNGDHKSDEPRRLPLKDERIDNPEDIRWHDIHIMLEGTVVQDVILNFTQRWNAFLDDPPGVTSNYPLNMDGITPIVSPPQAPLETVPDWPGPDTDLERDAPITPHVALNRGDTGRRPGRGTQVCAIVRTIPQEIDAYDSFVKARPIPDDGAPLGELGCRAAIENAINNARRYIYIEDQYFVEPELTQLLMARLTDPEPKTRLQRLFVVVPHILADFEPVDAIYHHFRTKHSLQIREAIRLMLGTERGVDPNSIGEKDVDSIFTIAHLQHPTGSQIYLHAKHMIVDDLWMSISSANFSRRGMTYEVEIGATVMDAEIEDGVRKCVRDHRIRLWAEHLNLDRSDWYQLLDPISGADLLHKSLLNPKMPLIPFEVINDNIPFRYDPENHTGDLQVIYDFLGDVDGRISHDPIDVETARNLVDTILGS